MIGAAQMKEKMPNQSLCQTEKSPVGNTYDAKSRMREKKRNDSEQRRATEIQHEPHCAGLSGHMKELLSIELLLGFWSRGVYERGLGWECSKCALVTAFKYERECG